MKSVDILKKAVSYVADSREKEYGNKLKNHDNIAKLWSAYKDTEFTARDVAVMMALLKVARTKQGKVSEDTFIDGAAYMAIAGDIHDELHNK